jgi:MerR family transcriptional regulator, repressor of the yfmOP operon
MTEQEQLTRILTLVELSNSRLDKLDQDIRATNQRIEEETKRWDDRFFQLVKEVKPPEQSSFRRFRRSP